MPISDSTCTESVCSISSPTSVGTIGYDWEDKDLLFIRDDDLLENELIIIKVYKEMVAF